VGRALAAAGVYIPGTDYNRTGGKDGHYVLAVVRGKDGVRSRAVGHLADKQPVVVNRGAGKHERCVLRPQANPPIEREGVRGTSAIQEVRETPFNVVALDATSHYNSTLNLAHLLDKASGVKIRETGGVGSDMNITLNGFTGRNIRVFMDGVPMEGMGTAFQLNNIPVNMTVRIDVYRGVLAIELGTDSMGGLINIVTNRTLNTTVDVWYAYGSLSTNKSN